MKTDIEMKKTIRAAALLLLLAPGAGLVACTRGETQEKQATTDTAPVERRDLVITAEAAGQIEPHPVVEVK